MELVPPAGGDTPEALLARWRGGGDAAALAALFDATAPDLFRIALATAPDPATAEDALQETFLALMEAAPRVDLSRPLVPFLVGILRHKVEKGRARNRRIPDPARLPDPDLRVEDPVRAAERSEEAEKVRRAILALPEAYRQAALLRWTHGLEPAEIAEVLGKPPGTVWSLLSRARERLKRSLAGVPVVLAAGVRPPRGLGAIREAVVARAEETAGAAAGGGAAIAAGGILVGKKAAMAAAVLAAILLWWTRPGGEGDPAPVIPAPPAILVSEGTDAARLQGVHVPPTPAVAGVEAPEGVPLASATGGAAASPFGFVPTTGGLHSGGVFGRLVDEERRPVAGASVTLLLGGRLLGSADSGGEGEFFLPPVPIEAEGATHFRYLLLAADGKGRAARAQAMVTMTTDPGEWSGEGAAVMLPHMSMGTLTLRKAFPVEVLVTAGGVPVGGALVAAEEPGGRAGTGEFPTDPEGRARLESIPGGDWILRARGSGLGTGRILARVPAGDAIRIPLALRPLEIEVRDAATESPVEGVRLLVSRPVPGAEEGAWRTDFPPLLSPPSDSAGRILIADAGEGPLRLFPVRAGKEEPEAGVDPVEVAAGEGRVRVPLAQGIRLRWTPAFGDRDPPPEGSRVEVALGNDAMDGILLLGYGEVREARVEGGSLLLDGVEDIGPFAVARAPDGALARLAPPGREADPPAARFFTPRKLSVSVRDEDGRHVPGLVALLTPQGASLAHPQELDGEGRITFRGLLPETVAVCVLARTQWGGAEAARVDLTAGDGSVEAVVGREFLLRIRVRTGGKPGLPGEYELRLLTPGPACRGEPHFEYAEEAEEAPAAGEIRIRVRPHAPGAAVKVALRAKGGAWREAEVRPPAAGGEAEAAIELPTE